jgi:hypothetical protein
MGENLCQQFLGKGLISITYKELKILNSQRAKKHTTIMGK